MKLRTCSGHSFQPLNSQEWTSCKTAAPPLILVFEELSPCYINLPKWRLLHICLPIYLPLRTDGAISGNSNWHMLARNVQGSRWTHVFCGHISRSPQDPIRARDSAPSCFAENHWDTFSSPRQELASRVGCSHRAVQKNLWVQEEMQLMLRLTSEGCRRLQRWRGET